MIFLVGIGGQEDTIRLRGKEPLGKGASCKDEAKETAGNSHIRVGNGELTESSQPLRIIQRPKMRALLVEDDVEIAKQIAAALEKERLTVQVAADGETGLDEALSRTYSIAILDVMLPKRDGWSLCDEIRRAGINMPVLMLTARDSVEDRVKGLEGGADDYLPKPFDARELVARVRALLRRDAVHRTGKISIDDLEIDTHAQTVTRGGNALRLTPREYSLLVSLARNEGRILTREVILEDVWNNEESLENTVNFHITSLRKKVDYPGAQKLIHTVHGFGYSLRRPGGEG